MMCVTVARDSISDASLVGTSPLLQAKILYRYLSSGAGATHNWHSSKYIYIVRVYVIHALPHDPGTCNCRAKRQLPCIYLLSATIGSLYLLTLVLNPRYHSFQSLRYIPSRGSNPNPEASAKLRLSVSVSLFFFFFFLKSLLVFCLSRLWRESKLAFPPRPTRSNLSGWTREIKPRNYI